LAARNGDGDDSGCAHDLVFARLPNQVDGFQTRPNQRADMRRQILRPEGAMLPAVNGS
jgi:hypothetical protein